MWGEDREVRWKNCTECKINCCKKGLIATSLRRSSTVLNDIEVSCGVVRNGIDRTKSVLRLIRVSRACTIHQRAILAVNGDQ